MKTTMPSKGWDVYLENKRFMNGKAIEYKHVDTVFFDASMDADEVKRSLVDHDGYDPNIMVRCGGDDFDDDER